MAIFDLFNLGLNAQPKKQIIIETYVLIFDFFSTVQSDVVFPCTFCRLLVLLQLLYPATIVHYCSLLVGAVMQFYICSSMCVCTLYIHVSVCVVIGALNA